MAANPDWFGFAPWQGRFPVGLAAQSVGWRTRKCGFIASIWRMAGNHLRWRWAHSSFCIPIFDDGADKVLCAIGEEKPCTGENGRFLCARRCALLFGGVGEYCADWMRQKYVWRLLLLLFVFSAAVYCGIRKHHCKCAAGTIWYQICVRQMQKKWTPKNGQNDVFVLCNSCWMLRSWTGRTQFIEASRNNKLPALNDSNWIELWLTVKGAALRASHRFWGNFWRRPNDLPLRGSRSRFSPAQLCKYSSFSSSFLFLGQAFAIQWD